MYSFIIPSYNSQATIERCLKSILQLNDQQLIQEIIVVDSSDDQITREKINLFNDPRFIKIYLNQKTSPAMGRNRGGDLAQGRVLVFIDSDVELNILWLNKIHQAYQDGCHFGCGAVNIPHDQEKNSLALAQWYLQFNESLPVGKRRIVSMVPACNMFIQKDIFKNAQGFPLIRASEDVLLCLKVSKNHSVWFIPDAICYHIFRTNRQSYKNNQIVLGEYIIAYRRGLYQKWFYQGLWPLVLLPAFLIIKSLRIKLRIFKAGSKHVLNYLTCLPLYTYGFFFWGVGFCQGCFKVQDNKPIQDYMKS